MGRRFRVEKSVLVGLGLDSSSPRSQYVDLMDSGDAIVVEIGDVILSRIGSVCGLD